MAKKQSKRVVFKSNYYSEGRIEGIIRQTAFIWYLLVAFAVLMIFGGCGGFNRKDYPYAIGAICVGIALIVVSINGIKKVRKNNKLYKGLSEYKYSSLEARNSNTVTDFIPYYDKMVKAVTDVVSINPDQLIDGMVAEGRSIELENCFQGEIKNVIDREMSSTLSDLHFKYKHSLRNKEVVYNNFWRDIYNNSGRFSDETKLYADQAVELVYQASGSTNKKHHLLFDGVLEHIKATVPTTIANEAIEEYLGGASGLSIQKKENSPIKEVDSMSGLDFERWCASVLRKNGFVKVRVTQGSNDQGVDILAEKEGVKYAIQCKCYSSDLSNTPVQEVNAGKKFYDCHVGVVMTNSHFTKGAVALAKKTGVLLWDREVVARMAEKE